jgi:hypothetical protein
VVVVCIVVVDAVVIKALQVGQKYENESSDKTNNIQLIQFIMTADFLVSLLE